VKSKTVLIVDDIPLMRVMLRRYLNVLSASRGDIDIQVVEAADGSEALEVLAATAVDLIFLDLMMPNMDGLSFLKRCKNSWETGHVPVVVTTALGEDVGAGEALEAGAEGYIRKPFTMESIREQVEKFLPPSDS